MTNIAATVVCSLSFFLLIFDIFPLFIFKYSYELDCIVLCFIFLFLCIFMLIRCKMKSSTDGFLLEKDKDDYHECVGLLNLPHDSSMECIMTELFKKFHIDNAVWQLSKNTKYNQIIFFVESNTHHELILTILNEWGIGQRNGSSMSMIPCAIYNQASNGSHGATAE